MRNNRKRLATWIDVTDDAAPTTPEITFRTCVLLQWYSPPSILLIDPVDLAFQMKWKNARKCNKEIERERKGEKEKTCRNRIRKKINNIKGKEMYLLSPHPDSSFCVCFELVFIKLLKYFGLLFAFSQNNCRSNEQRKLKIGWRVPLDERRVDISDDI